MNAGSHRARQDSGGSFSIDEMNIPDAAYTGDLFDAQAVLTNHTQHDARFDITWFINGTVAGVEEIGTGPGPFMHSPGDTHSYTIELGPVPEGETEVCAEVGRIRDENDEQIDTPKFACDTMRDPDATPGGIGIPLPVLILMLAILVLAYLGRRRYLDDSS